MCKAEEMTIVELEEGLISLVDKLHLQTTKTDIASLLMFESTPMLKKMITHISVEKRGDDPWQKAMILESINAIIGFRETTDKLVKDQVVIMPLSQTRITQEEPVNWN